MFLKNLINFGQFIEDTFGKSKPRTFVQAGDVLTLGFTYILHLKGGMK